MKKSSSEIRTASWQYDSMDLAAGMDNKDHPSYKKLTKYSGNPSKSPAGSPDHIDKGRGPTRGLTGALQAGPATPPASAVPASIKIKNPDYINGGAQVRTPGGVKEMPKCGRESFDMGRGPTKGNAQ
jgi:hypothetical protein